MFAFGAVSPWLTLVDAAKFGKRVDLIQNLDLTTIASCHSPVIDGPFIGHALDTVRQLPSVEPPPMPDQSVLEQIVAATSQPRA
jgi:hypothetical protein